MCSSKKNNYSFACFVTYRLSIVNEKIGYHPIENLKDNGIDYVICEGLGRKALEKLNDGGIKVFRIDRSTVKDIVEDFSDSKLEEIDPENVCRNHRCH